MKVSDLRQHLTDLAKLLKAADAKNVLPDLAAIVDALTPFQDLPLKGFAEFLIRAERYASTGEVSVQPPKAKQSSRPARSSQPTAAQVESLRQEVKQTYEAAASPSMTAEQIESLMRQLTRLKKDDLVIAAKGIGISTTKSMSKGDLLTAIQQHILARKGATLRAGMTERHEANDGNGAAQQASGLGARP